nr:immunoglobulin heavy chain junction region [Mus musculus]
CARKGFYYGNPWFAYW